MTSWRRTAAGTLVLASAWACGRKLTPIVPAVPERATAAVPTRDSAGGRLDTAAARRSTPRGTTPRGATPRGTTSSPQQKPVATAEAPPILREFRGVWVATVRNMDWPSKRTLSTAEQQAELRAIFDRAQALKLNAVIFQVRPAGDALYASRLEPWSEFLTGVQGKRPEPFWDPLAFAIDEAHARGIELHAWFNPYRAGFVKGASPAAASHVRRTTPALVKTYGPYLWMDPGEKAVRAHTVRVVVDVVKRYDVDGIHLDDYFYPYPENDRRGRVLPFPDAASYARYRKAGGTLDKADWRRDNVNTLVRELDEAVHKAKPWVRFGISPFGIWRPGYPAQIKGFDAYEKLYADARKWLREGWVDYFTPQLYWPTTKVAQSYPVLLDWWAGENVRQRHLWPGNFTSLAGGRGSTAFPVSDLLEQIRLTRLQPGASGNVHFSMTSFLKNQAGMNDTLQVGPYAAVALPPASPWLPNTPPATPVPQLQRGRGATQLRLGTPGRTAPWQWVVRLRTDTAWITMLLPGATDRWAIPHDLSATKVTISALNRVGIESPPVSLSLVTGSTTSPTERFE